MGLSAATCQTKTWHVEFGVRWQLTRFGGAQALLFISSPKQAEDMKMQEIMRLAHEFLQNFCAGNQQNQALLHKHINLFLNPGVSWGSGELDRVDGGGTAGSWLLVP